MSLCGHLLYQVDHTEQPAGDILCLVLGALGRAGLERTNTRHSMTLHSCYSGISRSGPLALDSLLLQVLSRRDPAGHSTPLTVVEGSCAYP